MFSRDLKISHNWSTALVFEQLPSLYKGRWSPISEFAGHTLFSFFRCVRYSSHTVFLGWNRRLFCVLYHIQCMLLDYCSFCRCDQYLHILYISGYRGFLCRRDPTQKEFHFRSGLCEQGWCYLQDAVLSSHASFKNLIEFDVSRRARNWITLVKLL